MIDSGLILYQIVDGEPKPLDYAINGINLIRWLWNHGMSAVEEIVDIEVSITHEGVMELQIEVSDKFFDDTESKFYYIQPAKMFFKP